MGCRFITGPVGDQTCSCRELKKCFKSHAAGTRLKLTPRCYRYHDWHVVEVAA